jgi:hypothetical protein
MNIQKAMTKAAALIATGGPGASRFFLLSIIVYLVGTTESAGFSSDLYVLLIVNLSFTQSFGFFYFNEQHRSSFWTILNQSSIGLFLSIVIISSLSLVGIVENMLELVLLSILFHLYFMFRYKLLAEKKFIALSISECILSLFCIITPFIIYYFFEFSKAIPHLIYTIGALIATLLMAVTLTQLKTSEKNKVSLIKVRNISLGNLISSLIVLCIPIIIKAFGTTELVSLTAVSISTLSIIFLIPRAYANTFLSELGSKDITHCKIVTFEKKYFNISTICSIFGLIFSSIYIYMLIDNIEPLVVFIICSLSCLLLLMSQGGFVVMNYLSLNGYDNHLLKVHSITLLFSITCLSGLYLTGDNLSPYNKVYLMFLFFSAAFILRKTLAYRVYKKYAQ